MEEEAGRPTVPRFAGSLRRAVSSDIASLVTIEPTSDRLPAMAEPVNNGVDLIAWAHASRSLVQTTLSRCGAILFRGFHIGSPSDFERFVTISAGQPLAYLERSSPRTQLTGHIYSSTEYPADQSIFLHCENSYQKAWPLRIFFHCQVPPESGGETPIADTRRILSRIPGSVQDKFAQRGVLYVRNFGPGLGLSWQTVFQTDDRIAVEQYCLSAGIEYEWDGDLLRTKHVRKAIHSHPITGESVWFNHAAFFHVSTLDPTTQKVLGESLSETDLPNNTYYGDGSRIEPDVLEVIRNAYRDETVKFPWKQGDILMLDNMLIAHGRSPYRGERRILVGMTDLYSA